MRVVVTGGSGFVAGRLVPDACAAGYDVVTLDRRPGLGMTEHVTAELTDPGAAATGLLRSADAVVHLAGCPGVRDASPDVDQRRRRDNVLATEVVAALTRDQVPLVVFSSSSVYGGARVRPEGLRSSHENDRLTPRGGYGESKLAAERVCAARAARGGSTLVVRPFTVLGEGQREDMAVAAWSAQARRGEPLTVLGSPDRTRDVTDVRDVAAATLALLDAGAQGVVNLGTGRGRTLREIAEATCRAVGAAALLDVVEADDVEVGHTLADTERLQSWAGFVPRTDLDDVVRRAAAVSSSETRVVAAA